MNIEKIRKDFSVYERKINGLPLIYMDSACVTLKPNQVIDAMNRYYKEFPACAGRSAHTFGREVTEEIKKARKTTQKFINAKKSKEIVFTRKS